MARPTRACSSLHQLDTGQQSTPAVPQHPGKASEAAAEELSGKLECVEPAKRLARGKRKANQAVAMKDQSLKPKRRSGSRSASMSDVAMHQSTLLPVVAMHAYHRYYQRCFWLYMELASDAAVLSKQICQVQGTDLIVSFFRRCQKWLHYSATCDTMHDPRFAWET